MTKVKNSTDPARAVAAAHFEYNQKYAELHKSRQQERTD